MEYIKRELPKKVFQVGLILTVVGLLFIGISYGFNYQRALFNNLIGFVFAAGVSIGALVLVALEYLAGATWSVPSRRVSEFLAAALPFVFILALPLLFNLNGVFHWAHITPNTDELIKHKSPYLNEWFLIIRFFVVFGVFYLFYSLFIKNSRKQDASGDQKLTRNNVKLSAPFMIIAGIGISLIAIDWLMSLEPHWYSTIFGIYYISTTLLAGLAATTLVVVLLKEKGYLHPRMTSDHYYSFGALLFGITNFWAYIAFSQFLLIWYANIPEETSWFMMRWVGNWKYVSILLIIIKFAIPYLGLLTYPSKTDPKRLVIVSAIILFAHLFDMYWLVMPSYSKTVILGIYEIGFPVFIVGVYIILFYFLSKKQNLVPINDPKLERGLDFHL